MKLLDNTNIHQSEKKIPWLEMICYVSDIHQFDEARIERWAHNFGSLTVAAPTERPANLAKKTGWFRYDSNRCKTDHWNQLLSNSSKEWVLFIENNEEPVIDSLPEKMPADSNTWNPILYRIETENADKQQYQIRLVRSSDEPVFTGNNLPDATRFIIEKEINLSRKPFLARRSADQNKEIDPLDELSVQYASPQAYLLMGERYFKKRKYVHAAAQYRQVLKMKKLLPFDRLAAVNGLASCMTEQYKWPKALVLTQESIEAEPFQRMPYLIQFRIHQLKKEWAEAHRILSRYYEMMNIYSRANFDKSISEEDTLVELGEMALKAGMTRKAAEHFEELYAYKDGDVERDFLMRLFVLSAELDEYEKAVYYFERLFGPYMPDKLSRQAMEQLNECTDFFMKRGWYDYVLKIYEQLVEEQPKNNDFRRRLVVALSKTNRMERARELIGQK